MIHVGTSGFSYDDWPGLFYPPRTPKGRMFDCYCEWFGAVEINASFYGVPSLATTRSLLRRAGGRVVFTAKMTEEVTHRGDLGDAVVSRYRRFIEPFAEAGRLGAILLQFPFRFHCAPETRAYLNRAIKTFEPFPLVVEIRHDSWQAADGMSFFRDERISLCIVDMPRMSRLPRAYLELTGPIAYVRFHGRNGRHWFKDSYPGAPYDYLYSGAELAQWIAPLKKMERKAETAFAFFNNHLHAQAPQNAQTMMALLSGGEIAQADSGLFAR